MTPEPALSTRVPDGEAGLGVLSVHLDGRPCRVGCDFCYLGARLRQNDAAAPDLALLGELLGRLAFEELAVAVSEPADEALPALAVLADAARARKRPLAITTTLSIAAQHPDVLAFADRVSLSVDPRKGPVEPARIDAVAAQARGGGAREIALIVSLITPEYADRLTDGLLAEYVDLPHVDRVALNGLKPPPPWCDRAFWMRALGRLEPLLQRALDRRLFLDCYVAARLVGLGGCPARADLTPAADGFAFRSCVYQPEAELVASDAASLVRHVRDFQPPKRCPFPIV